MTITNCPECGGAHFGSYTCPMKDARRSGTQPLHGKPLDENGGIAFKCNDCGGEHITENCPGSLNNPQLYHYAEPPDPMEGPEDTIESAIECAQKVFDWIFQKHSEEEGNIAPYAEQAYGEIINVLVYLGDIKKQSATVERYRKVLEYYGDEKVYRLCLVMNDKGSRARAALGSE